MTSANAIPMNDEPIPELQQISFLNKIHIKYKTIFGLILEKKKPTAKVTPKTSTSN